MRFLQRELKEHTSNARTDAEALFPFECIRSPHFWQLTLTLLSLLLPHPISPPHTYDRRLLLYLPRPSHHLAFKRLSTRLTLDYDDTLRPILILTHHRNPQVARYGLSYISKHWQYPMPLNAAIDNIVGLVGSGTLSTCRCLAIKAITCTRANRARAEWKSSMRFWDTVPDTQWKRTLSLSSARLALGHKRGRSYGNNTIEGRGNNWAQWSSWFVAICLELGWIRAKVRL